MHCEFVQEAELEGLFKTYRLTKEAFCSKYEVNIVQVMPTRLREAEA